MIFGLRRVHAFSLVEVTLAIGVAAFCLLAVFGLVPIGVQTNRNATSQTAATNILSSVVSDIRATPKTVSTSTQYGISLSANSTTTLYFDGQGQFATSLGADSRYRLTEKGIAEPPLADDAREAIKAAVDFVLPRTAGELSELTRERSRS